MELGLAFGIHLLVYRDERKAFGGFMYVLLICEPRLRSNMADGKIAGGLTAGLRRCLARAMKYLT